MRTLAPLPLPLLCFPHHPPSQNLVFYPHSSSTFTRNSPKIPRKTIVFGLNSKDPKESLFFDENGAVEDMEGYLNQLSLEYDSVWDTKPSWCQPWTITLTGILVIATSWLILRSAPVTSVISLLICAWWYIFLYSYPKASKMQYCKGSIANILGSLQLCTIIHFLSFSDHKMRDNSSKDIAVDYPCCA